MPALYCPRCSWGPVVAWRALRDHAEREHGVALNETFGHTDRADDRDR